jgi:hypothetical protein
VISLEPSGSPDPATLPDVPHLFIWGDYYAETDFWVRSRPASKKWHNALLQAGCDTTFLDLPKQGIHGNSHALMADDDSDEIAGLVIQWMTARGLLRG